MQRTTATYGGAGMGSAMVSLWLGLLLAACRDRTPTPTPTSAPVEEASAPYPTVSGAYDLAGTITAYDSAAWGPIPPRYVAFLSITQGPGAREFSGTYSGFCNLELEELSCAYPGTGHVKGTVERDGKVLIDLLTEEAYLKGWNANWSGRATLVAGRLEGAFGAGGHITGTFAAVRR